MKKIILLTLTLLMTSCGISKTSSSVLSSSSISSKTSEETSISIDPPSISSLEPTSSTSIDPSIEPNEDEFGDILYNPGSDIKITLEMSNNAGYRLTTYGSDSHNTTADIYHPAKMTLKVNDKEYIYDEVGVRMKGNTSRNPDFIDETGHFKKTGTIEDFANLKISVATDFKDNDYYTPKEDTKVLKDRRLAGEKKVDLKFNRNTDNTFTKEAYAQYMFLEEGLTASRENIINFEIKTESDSQSCKMSLQECMDKQSLKIARGKEDSKGNLYKGNWPCDLASRITNENCGVEDCTKGYFPAYDLKTNDDEPDHTLLKTVVSELTANDAGETQANLKQKFDKYVDSTKFIKFAALSYLIGNPDDLRNNKNNVYYYFNKEDKLEVIARDTDRCFGILDTWDVDMSNQYPTTTKGVPTTRDWCASPIFWRSIIHSDNGGYSYKWPVISEYENLYKQYCIEYFNKYMNTQSFADFTNNFVNAPSHNIDVGGTGYTTNQTFGYYVNGKTEVLKDLGWIS